MRLEPCNRAEELGIDDIAQFLRFVSACFRQKRKTIRNNLAGLVGKEVMEGWPEAGMRAEQLGLEAFAEMYRRTQQSLPRSREQPLPGEH